jgi:hypothetical protein
MHVVLERVVSQIAAELKGLDAELTQVHPGGLSYKWNAQQVTEHLVTSFRHTREALESRLRKGHRLHNVSRTRLQWCLQIMMLSFGRFPFGIPAMEETLPAPGRFPVMSGPQLSDLLRQEMEAMDQALDRCRQKFGMEKVARHPLLGPLRVDQWRRFHVVHGLHHVPQLRAIVAQVAPAAVPVRISSSALVKELQIPVQRPLT